MDSDDRKVLQRLEEDMLEENKKNEEKDRHVTDQGDIVTFGTIVILKHLPSGKLMSTTAEHFQGKRSSKVWP